MISILKQLKKDEGGSLLIIAIMIMATVVLTAVIASRLVTREVRLSRDIENALLALYASETGVEFGLYNVFINDAVAADINGSAGTLSNDATWIMQSADRAQTFFKETIERDTDLVLKLYNYDNPDSSANIDRMYINWKVGNGLHVKVESWDGSAFDVPIYDTDFYCSTVPCNQITLNLDSAKPNLVVITAFNDDIQDIEIEVEPATESIALPITIGVSGVFSSSGQAMEVRIPQRAPWE